MSSGGSSAPNRKSKEAREGRAGGRAERALGIDGSIVGRSKAENSNETRETGPFFREKRRAIWALSRTAAGLRYPKGTPKEQIKGVGTCRWAMQSKAAGVDVHLSEYDESGQTRASFGGLQTCGNVWQCPACAARISETRRRQLNDGLAWAREQGHRIAMITLTARHGEGDDLVELLRAMKGAKKRLHQHRAWKRIKPEIVAVLTATEVTYGRNGWHPHFHMLVIVRTKAAFEALAELGDPWRGALRAEDLDGAAAAFDCQGASAAGRYIGKWGAAEELTLSGKKRAKNKGRTPLQLLEACKAGNEEAGELWLEYADAFHGRTQLDGLKKLTDLAGLEEISDEEAAQDAEQEGQLRQDEPVANIDADTWRAKARHRRTDILDAAETNGAAGVWEVIEGPARARDLSRPPPLKKGGLAERAMAAIRKPDRSLPASPDLDRDIETVTQWGIYEEDADRGGDAAVRPPGREA
ncbi:MAG: protein rep, partial [Rhodobacterales bacterium]|nr:protein rep [Rhodobacterales bacterium]